MTLRDVSNWPRRFVISAVLFALVSSLNAAIKDDETVLLYPAMARSVGSSWEIDWQGVVFEPERRALTTFAMRRLLGLADISMTAEEEQVFAERSRLFLADNERRKTVRVRTGEALWKLGRSGPDGRFSSRQTLSRAQFDSSWRVAPDRLELPFRLVDGGDRLVMGEVHLIEPRGISVISDIDDTIKISEVLDREALLRNTFCRPFKPVPGMAPAYHEWSNKHRAAFHYVSASPWQLYLPLSEFVRSNGFPAGTFHLKEVRLKDRTAFDLLASPEKYKLGTIEPILRKFPEREFVLVGDSGEKDPEIYASLMKRHPKQIRLVLIRDVTGEVAESPRYRRTFEGLDPARWRVFKDATEIRSALPVSPHAGR